MIDFKVIGSIVVVSHHLRSLLGAIELTILYAFCMQSKIFLMLTLGRLSVQIRGLTYLPLWEYVTY